MRPRWLDQQQRALDGVFDIEAGLRGVLLQSRHDNAIMLMVVCGAAVARNSSITADPGSLQQDFASVMPRTCVALSGASASCRVSVMQDVYELTGRQLVALSGVALTGANAEALLEYEWG